MWHFLHFPENNSFWANYNDDIQRDKFVWFLYVEKHFFEDWKDTFRRWYYLKIKNGYPPDTDRKVSLKGTKRLRLINDLVDKALDKDYLIVFKESQISSYTSLKTNWRGRDFLRPGLFLNAVAKEYSDLTSISSVVLGSVGLTTIVIFWEKIMDWIVNFL
jgi:hypothetical protein